MRTWKPANPRKRSTTSQALIQAFANRQRYHLVAIDATAIERCSSRAIIARLASVVAQLRTRGTLGAGWPHPILGDHRRVKNTTCLSASEDFGTWWEWCSLSRLKEAPFRRVP